MFLAGMNLNSAFLRCMAVYCFAATMSACHMDGQSGDSMKSEMLQISSGAINMQKMLRRKGQPSLLVWDYDAGKPLWWIEPERSADERGGVASFKYGDIPDGYVQKYPSGSERPTEPTQDALVIFCLTFSYDTLFAASGENIAFAYVYENGSTWTSASLPDDAYTPEGWY